MKKIKDGKLYDTTKSIIVAMSQATLYKTKKGNFFTYTGNTQEIEPLDKKEALLWCEASNIDVEVIMKYFRIEEA